MTEIPSPRVAGPSQSGPSPGPRSFALRLIAIVLAVGLIAAIGWYVSRDKGTATAQATPPAPPVTVSSPLKREVVEWDEYTGQFSPVEYVELRARVSGYLTEIHFQDGQTVNKGDLLFVIDPRPYEIELANAKAQLEQAKAKLELANRQLARAGSLREKDFVAQSTYDERLNDMRSGAAAVQTAEAAIRQAELDLEFSHVTAPISGRISRHQVSIGNLISGGGNGATPTMLTTIVSLDPIYFYFDMSETDYLAYQRGAIAGKLQSTRGNAVQVFARLVDEKNWPHEGSLDFVENQLDRSAGTIRARAAFPNPGLLITPGQFGRLRLPGSEPYQAILIPDSAIVTDQSRKIVMTVKDDGSVVPKPVRPGPMIDGLRVVREGLGLDDKVIITGLMRARPGGKVTPQPGEIKAEVAQAN
jgi:RND family efflux transporter MFP subunit